MDQMFVKSCRYLIQRKPFLNKVKNYLLKSSQNHKFHTYSSLCDSNLKNEEVNVEAKILKQSNEDKLSEEKFWDAYQKHLKEQPNVYKPYLDRIRYRKMYENPVERAFKVMKDDVLEYFGKLKYNSVLTVRKGSDKIEPYMPHAIFPDFCDVVIIGGGVVGASIAYHLQERVGDGLRIVLVERDQSYSKASTVLSLGGIRQQFSVPENIILSKYGIDFLQSVHETLATPGYDIPNVGMNLHGYLILASEKSMPQLLENHQMQKEYNVQSKIYSKDQLKKIFPWINTDGIEGGSFGLQNEGWFDPWSLLIALTRKAKSLGTIFVNGEATNATYEELGDYVHETDLRKQSAMRQLCKVEITLPNGDVRSINCAVCIIAAGAWSKDVGRMCGIGNERTGFGSELIPVEPRKRYVYCFKSPNGPGLNCPLLIDSNGTYFRREGLGDLYLCGRSPEPDEEPSIEDLNVDDKFFKEKVWPSIAKRCPSFKNLKIQSSWAGYYDYNTLDQNAIIDRHPLYSNLFMATGFSGHGIQQSIGAGKALTELILDAEMKTLNLERLSFERVIFKQPLYEKCIY